MTTMRLSEAIRLGAALRPQAFGSLFDGGGSCAMGSAFEANGVQPAKGYIDDPVLKRLSERWNQIPMPTCPECHARLWKFTCQMVAHLNDTHRWTREQIADWVEQIERKHGLWDEIPEPATESAHA